MPSKPTTPFASAWSAAAGAALAPSSSACAPDNNVRLVAVADTFRDRAESCLTGLRNNAAVRNKVDVNAERTFIGLEAYNQVIQQADLVLLATPPGFRPAHIRAVIAARKNLFTEKPVAVDGPGIRAVLAAHDEANRHNLTVVAGTQRRYQTGYLQAMQRIRDGEIGTITSGRCYWNQGDLWHRARTLNMTDVEWQIRNWLYFTWLSGDHIVEQHVHNLDVMNWAINTHPVKCVGMGGRQVRTAPEFGHIFDHFAIDYTLPQRRARHEHGPADAGLCRQRLRIARRHARHLQHRRRPASLPDHGRARLAHAGRSGQ